MKKLTQEQIKILEDAFAGYPEDYKGKSQYVSMEGIQKQLDLLNGEPGFIFYISEMNVLENGEIHFVMEKMIPGVTVDSTTPIHNVEPTESQIKNRMELTQESYYTARENLREEAYGTTHSKPPGQSWGDYWKSY